MEKVSVLVAVHNAEKTIRRCIDSLLCQTIGDVQIICVDDASTDASLTILNDYAAQHSCVTVIALSENRGQAHARNQGIPLIKAPFTAFLDSDDYMAPDALEKARKTFEEDEDTDCVLLNVRYIYPDGREHGYRTPPFEQMTGYDAFIKSLNWDVHGWYVARTELYRRFPFDETCHSYSDDNITMAHYLHSRMVRCCDGKYFFTQHDDSCTHQATIRRFDWLKANMSMHRQLVKWGMKRDVIDIYERHRWFVLMDCYWFYYKHRNHFSPQDQTKALHIMHEAWKDIDTSTCLPWRIKYKPGYMPMKWSWTLFRWQEEILSFTRKIRKL